MTLEVVQLSCADPRLLEPLTAFYERLANSDDARWFNPHPFTRDEAVKRLNYEGDDLYYAVIDDSDVLGYGMLRGWDEGYAIPSLGIAVDASARSQGIGRMLMSFLEVAARRRDAKSIRLTVVEENQRAIDLYRSLGYAFTDAADERGRLVGHLELCR